MAAENFQRRATAAEQATRAPARMRKLCSARCFGFQGLGAVEAATRRRLLRHRFRKALRACFARTRQEGGNSDSRCPLHASYIFPLLLL